MRLTARKTHRYAAQIGQQLGLRPQYGLSECGVRTYAAYGIKSTFGGLIFIVSARNALVLTELTKYVATFLGLSYHLSTHLLGIHMSDDHEVDWGNDEDDPMVSRSYFDSVRTSYTIGGDEADDVEDAVSLGGDEEEEFAAYGARLNEQNTADRSQNTVSRAKRDARRRSASVGASPRKGTSQVQPAPLPPSPQSEIHQPTPKLTHALPPKPVVSSVHAPPSTTAASPMSLPRKERRSNGNTTKKGDEPPPSDKETRVSHTTDRDGRQRDSRTEESSWTRPSPSAADSQPLSRDRTRSFDDRDSRPSLRREDDCYRPSHHRAPHYSSDEEGREPNPHRTQSRYDARYRYNDRDQRQDYASGDRDRPVTRSARFPLDVESMDRSHTGYRESNDTDPRRAHPRDRDISPVRDDSSRRLQRRDDYSPYDSFDKGPRGYDNPPRRSAGTAERSRYPESFNGRANSVVLRDSHPQNQGPGRSSTLSTLSASCRPMPNAPYAFFSSRCGGPIFLFPETPWELSTTRIYASTDLQVFIVAFSIFVSVIYAMSRSQQLFPPACFIL